MINNKNILGDLIEKSSELVLKVKKLNESAIIPTRGTEDSAGLDLYAVEECCIPPGKKVRVHTGIAMQIPKDYMGLLIIRSGLGDKHLLRLSTGASAIDSDYRGDIMVPIYNDSDKDYHIKVCDRIAQLILIPYIHPPIIECDELDATNRDIGGFGSTGK